MLGRISCRCTVLLKQMIFTEQTQKSTKITYKQHAQKAFVKYCNTSFYINSTILQLKLRKSCVVLFCFVFFHLLHDTCPYSEFSGSYFPAFGLNMEIYSVNLCIQFKCGKIRTKKTPSEYRHFLCSNPKNFFFFIRDVLRILSSIVVNPLKPSVH